MDFLRYAEQSAALLNTQQLADRGDLVEHLAGRSWLHDQCTDRDATVLRRFVRELRPVFEASDVEDTRGVIDGLNQLMERHPITPRIADHDGTDLHLHVATRAASVAELLIGESCLAWPPRLRPGAGRLGVCSASPCTNVYVDTSPNQSRRYCSERCSSRANVAAYRARQKAGSTA